MDLDPDIVAGIEELAGECAPALLALIKLPFFQNIIFAVDELRKSVATSDIPRSDQPVSRLAILTFLDKVTGIASDHVSDAAAREAFARADLPKIASDAFNAAKQPLTWADLNYQERELMLRWRSKEQTSTPLEEPSPGDRLTLLGNFVIWYCRRYGRSGQLQ